MIQLSHWDLSASGSSHTEVACDSLGSLGGRQSALKVPGEVKSILEPQGRERWMMVQGIWLVPTWETVFCEQAWEV